MPSYRRPFSRLELEMVARLSCMRMQAKDARTFACIAERSTITSKQSAFLERTSEKYRMFAWKAEDDRRE
jgi:hypothetical protein